MTPLDHDDGGPASHAGNRNADVSFDVERATAPVPRERAAGETERDAPAVSERTLLAPAALAAAYAVLALAFGTELFDATRPGIPRLRAFALLGTMLVVSGVGTAKLYEDARRVARSNAGWSPSALQYEAGGAAALLGLRALQFALGAPAPARPVPYVIGNAVVAAALSTVVAGPIYVLIRRRRDEAR